MRIPYLLPGILFSLLTPQTGHAVILPNDACSLIGGAGSCNLLGSLGGVEGALGGALASIAALAFVYYGVRLAMTSDQDTAQSEIKQAIGQAILGAAVVGGVAMIASSVALGGPIFSAAAVKPIFTNLGAFIFGLLGAAIAVLVTVQAFRMITANDDGQVAAAKKRLVIGLIGGVVVVLASTIVSAFETSSGSTLTTEVAGIAEFLATLFGLLAVAGIMVGGMFLAFSATDSFKEKGKQTIIVSLIALIAVWASYAIVNLFI